MSERVLVLGAGASLGARAGLGVRTNDEPLPPLGRGLARYLLRWLNANDPARKLRPFMDGYHYPSSGKCPHYTGAELWRNELLGDVRAALVTVAAQDERGDDGPATPFERLMDGWSQAEDTARLGVVQRLLVYAMNFGYRCAFAKCADRYDALITWFQPTMVVTVNYDTLVEEAIQRRGCRYSYPGLEGPRAPEGPSIEIVSSAEGGPIVPMFKLHGSVNWHSIYGFAVGADVEAVDRAAGLQQTHIVESGPFIVSQTWASYAPPNRPSLLYELEEGVNTGEPIVAIYGTGKYIIANPEHVRQHRDTCLARLRDAAIDRVLAIGIRPVSEEDDPIVSRLIQQLGAVDGERTYVAPSADECEAMRARGFQPVRQTLAEFLSQRSGG